MKIGLSILSLLSISSALANTESGPPDFNFPLQCHYGKNCFIQNYFDTQPGPQAKDYRCGSMTYSGHKGTDIRIKNLVAMNSGVNVIAAAPGTVHAIRNNMNDTYLRKQDRTRLNPVGLGNAVIINHDNGWQSIYGHMKKSSVRVKKGDQVTTGMVIGEIGLSGLTEFPHLHFGIKHHGVNIDPFTASGASGSCGNTMSSLWSEQALETLVYQPGYLLDYGFSGTAPKNYKEVETGAFYNNLTPDDKTLFFWVRLAGLMASDSIELKLFSSDDNLIKTHRFPKNKNYKAQQVIYLGVKKDPSTFPVKKAQVNVWRNRILYINKTVDTPKE